MSIQRVSSYISSSIKWKYDVFLSFSGEDTRKTFTDHIYTVLNQKRINVFKDDKELERGKSISSELYKAIEESKFLIIIVSKNYVYSSWCLDELVKIVECKNKSDQQLVLPIFYDVEPTMVRKQSGHFQEVFAKHEEAFKNDIEKVQKWRDALKEAANFSGWELKERHEVEFIHEIVREISRKLRLTSSRALDDLVGINSRLEKLMSLIQTSFDDVRMIGICGMGGIGKTRIARAAYDLISCEFEGISFLANVREISEKGGLVPLQKQLLSEILMEMDISIYNDLDGVQIIRRKLRHKKVLLVVDDVVHISQLNKLVGKHSWFGSGSRIIITTRDEHLLISHRVNDIYKAEALNEIEALQLFSLKAFGDNQPPKDYVELTKHVVKYACGLPLALDVLGSFLFARTIDEWKSALERLNKDSENEIINVLRISFDGLKETEKKIFLDIACFFKGENRNYVTKILEGCGVDPVIGIRVLVEKSMIAILDENKLWMHDLLQEMGRQIIKRQFPEEPGKRSRLLEKADVCHVLAKNMGTQAVEAIKLDYFPEEEEVHLICASAQAFSKMTNLRLLMIHNVQLPEGLEYLSNELRLLKWHGYPLKSLPSNFRMERAIEVNMCYSHIKQIWSGIKPLNNLKFMRLSHSRNLIRTPDFTGVPNLEELDLEGCTRLCEIHPSLLLHKKLILLSLKGCTSLKTLPSKIAMESLTKFVLSGCSKLRRFPKIVGSMKCLSDLHLDGTAIKELPLSIDLLSGLVLLNLRDCKNLRSLPGAIANGLKYLKTLDLSGCSKLENVPQNLGKIESLEELDMHGIAIRKPVSSIFLLKNLKAGSSLMARKSCFMARKSLDPMALTLPSLSGLSFLTKLDLRDCNLGKAAIPNDICDLSSLKELNLSKNNFVSLPETFNRLSELRYLNLESCKWLQFLPELPSDIWGVKVDGCASLETLLDAIKLCKLKVSFINCINCLKLLNNIDLAFAMAKTFFEKELNSRSYFRLVVPGSKIPKWFRYQNEGSSITMVDPPDSYCNKNKLVGYAVCSIFHVHKHAAKVRSSCSYPKHELICCIKHEKFKSSSFNYLLSLREELVREMSDDHLWLFYSPNQQLYRSHWQSESNHIEISFHPYDDSCPEIEVKRCGFLPVYVDEVQDSGMQPTNGILINPINSGS